MKKGTTTPQRVLDFAEKWKLENPPGDEGRYNPVRKGHIFCAPRCGFSCTYPAFLKAIEAALALCDELGEDWTPRVWENGDWHHTAQSKAGQIYPHRDGTFWADLRFAGKQFHADGDTARSAYTAAVGKARHLRDGITKDFKKTTQSISMKLAAFHYTSSGKSQVSAAPTIAEVYTLIDRHGLQIHEVAEVDAEDFDIWRETRLRKPDSLEVIQRTYKNLGYVNAGFEIPDLKDWKRVFFSDVSELYASHSTRQFYRISQ